MLTFFTDPYEDELLYGAISRYHYYIGNIDFKDTLIELFGKDSIVPTLLLSTNLEYLLKQLGGKYTPKYFINNHTGFPFYSPFLPIKRRNELKQAMSTGTGKALYTKLGLVAGAICRKEGIYYCPICSKKEIREYGEPYIHREHQLQGVAVCPHHGATLKKYIMDRTNSSRIEFIRLDEKLLDFNVDFEKRKSIYNKLLKISKAAYYLLKNDLSEFTKDSVAERYKKLLANKDFLTINKRIKQNELHKAFVDFYGKDILEIFESSIDVDNEYNWLKVISRNSKRTVHPIRHILFIQFLVEDIKEFFNLPKVCCAPFGKSPWPCLNPVSPYYKKEIITDLKITPDYKTRLPVGTFKCDCGFIYSRKGPDKTPKDRYKIGRIKEFGHVWESKLKSYLQEGKYGLRQLARLMQCDPGTIKKYDKKLGINYYNEVQDIKDESKKISKENEAIDIEAYKKKIKEVIKTNLELSRTEIRKLCQKEYTYLYRHDKAWLYKNLPKKKDKQHSNSKNRYRVNWDLRDIEILDRIEEQYNNFLASEEPVRITKSILGKATGLFPMLDKKIDKLPKTKKFLDDHLESVQAFQLRRSKKMIDQKLAHNEYIKLWEIQRMAGIRSSHFNNIRDCLEDYIERGTRH
jgi:hypothetical protein